MSIEALPGTGDGPRVLRATGELDVASAPPLFDDVPDLVAGAPAVVLDLADVAFLDSSGVRLVDRITRACGSAGVRLSVVAPPGTRARRVLDLVGVAAALIVDSLPAGLDAVSRDPA